MKIHRPIFILILLVLLHVTANEIITDKDNLPAYDICNLDLIYDKTSDYEYTLPRNLLESYLSGKAFDNPIFYTEEEKKNVQEDINDIFVKLHSSFPQHGNLAVITAGAPGSGKTIKQKQDLAEKGILGHNIAYTCPDDVCLKNLTRTYLTEITSIDGSKESRLAAYNKWRPAANAAAHLILANLIREGYSFYFGTTSTGPATWRLFEFLKKRGYQIRLLHFSAPDKIRWESIVERDKVFVQTTEQDIREKGLLLPQRIVDTYLTYADIIEFYYRDEVKQDAQLAAIWVRNHNNAESMGTLEIVHSENYQMIKSIHNSAINLLNRPELTWEMTVESCSIMQSK